MEDFIQKLVEQAPSVGVLLYLVHKLMKQNDGLVQAIIDCYEQCEKVENGKAE